MIDKYAKHSCINMVFEVLNDKKIPSNLHENVKWGNLMDEIWREQKTDWLPITINVLLKDFLNGRLWGIHKQRKRSSDVLVKGGCLWKEFH